MRRLRKAGWIGAAAVVAGFAQSVTTAAGSDAPRLYLPFSYPPDGSSMMGEAFAGTRSPVPGIDVPLVPPAAKGLASPGQTERLNDLFHRLATTQDADEAKAIASRIGLQWRQSGSETADLLMSRALKAYRKGNSSVALDLLDRLVVLEPDWAEAWDKRAFLRLIADDRNGAMEDIAHVLRLEPRQFVALAGMGLLLRRAGMNKQALAIFRKAAALYPANIDLQQMIGQLIPVVEGRPN